MSEEFGSSSSVKVLAWLTQYKKLSARPPAELSPAETKTLKDMESKLARTLQQKSAGDQKADSRRQQQLRVEAHHVVRLSTAGEVQKAYIKNISGGGLFIETEARVEMGRIVTIDLHLPDDLEPVTVKGEVAWTNPKKGGAIAQGFGVKFVDLSEGIRGKIQKLLNQCLERGLKR